MGELCRHCGVKRANRPRGLCWACYYTPEISARYPSLSKYAARYYKSRGDTEEARPLPRTPTQALPGSAEKVAIMEARFVQNVDLHHPLDKRDFEGINLDLEIRPMNDQQSSNGRPAQEYQHLPPPLPPPPPSRPATPKPDGLDTRQRNERVQAVIRALGPDCRYSKVANHLVEEGIEITEAAYYHQKAGVFGRHRGNQKREKSPARTKADSKSALTPVVTVQGDPVAQLGVLKAAVDQVGGIERAQHLMQVLQQLLAD